MDVTKIMSKFTNIEAHTLKLLHRQFSRKELEHIASSTLQSNTFNENEKKYFNILRYTGLGTNVDEENKYGNNVDNRTTLSKYAKWAADNWTEEGDYKNQEHPIKAEIDTYEVTASESGSQVIYRSGYISVKAWNQEEAEDKAIDDFYDWGGEMEDDDWGDWYGDGIEIDDITIVEQRIMQRVIKEGMGPDDGFVAHHNLPEPTMIKVINKAVNQEIPEHPKAL